MSFSITGDKVLAAVIALFVVAVWPAMFLSYPFVLIGLLLIWFPGNRLIALWLARGLPTQDSPPCAVSLVAWLFLIGMPVLFWFLVPD